MLQDSFTVLGATGEFVDDAWNTFEVPLRR